LFRAAVPGTLIAIPHPSRDMAGRVTVSATATAQEPVSRTDPVTVALIIAIARRLVSNLITSVADVLQERLATRRGGLRGPRGYRRHLLRAGFVRR
jgi:mannitol/fructose-specific phosphotransferase system IIA component